MWKIAVVILTIGVVMPGTALAAPTASFVFAPGSPLTGEVVTFTSTSTGTVASQTWDLDEDNSCDDASGASVQRSFPTSRTYTVTLCVSDGIGGRGSQSQPVPVRNRPPVAAFNLAPSRPAVGETVVLTSFSADPDGPLVSQAWDLDGDGAFDDGQGSTATVSFAAAGDYPVKLLVTDRDGAASLAVRAIEVHAPLAQFIRPFPVVRVVGDVRKRGTRIKEIIVRVPTGSQVRIRCRGGGCPRPAAKRTGGVRTARTLHVRRFARRVLRPRAVLTISITKPGTIGKYTRLRIRRGKPPSRIDRCLLPGGKRPVRCPV
jgi:hypothetical protein